MDENMQTGGEAAEKNESETVQGSAGGDLTPSGVGLPSEQRADEGEALPPNRGGGSETVSLRYRKRDAHLRFAGLAIAVFVLLVAVLIACMAAGNRGGGEDPADTTGASDETTESTADSGPETAPEKIDLYDFDPAEIPEGHVGFRPMDLSGEAGTVTNLTSLTPNLEELLARFDGSGAETGGEEAVFTDPLVLILHTHTTEAYSAEGAISWDGNGEFARSSENAENVIAVGAVLAEALNGAGIPTIHCEIYHDVTDEGAGTYAGSYDRSAETVEHYKALYPSLKYVIDLHRDAVFDEDGNAIRAVTAIDGEPVAQVMAVVGSSEGGTAINWEQNLAFALALTEELNAENACISRAPVLKSSSFHQELTEYGLILEMGTASNTLAEAKAAAEHTAAALAEVIRTIER